MIVGHIYAFKRREMFHAKKVIIISALCFIALSSRYIQRIETKGTRIVMVGPGYGLEINGGHVLTALHVAEKMDYPIIYQNPEKDMAIIFTGHINKYNINFISSKDNFIFTDTAPKLGESGMPYILDNQVCGVIIGESGGRGLAATFDESIIVILEGGYE